MKSTQQPEFSKFERNVISVFEKAGPFVWNKEEFFISIIGKPRPPRGECKTDVYILAKNKKGDPLEFKISVKKSNAEFLENKTTAERAEAIFGPDWKRIIQKSTEGLRKEFEERPLIFKSSFGHTEEGSIMLGWKFEIMYHPGGELSGELSLNPEEIREVFTGENLPKEKRDASVNGNIIPNSGVSDFIVFEKTQNLETVKDLLDSMQSINEFLKTQNRLYFACKALNYRSLHLPNPKWDSDRPLAVYVDWTVQNNKLNAQLVFDKPLIARGNAVGKNLQKALTELGVKNANALGVQNVADPRIIFAR